MKITWKIVYKTYKSSYQGQETMDKFLSIGKDLCIFIAFFIGIVFINNIDILFRRRCVGAIFGVLVYLFFNH